MSLRSRAIVSLSWTLLVAIIVGMVNCEPLASKVDTSVDTKDEKHQKQQQSSPRKYLELDDLNAFESPAASYASGEDLVEGYDHLARNARPKKFAKRDVQQQQQQRTRITRQNQKKPRPGFFWTIAKVTFETFNDTRSAIQQISQIINDSLAPETTAKKPKKPLTKKPVVIAPIPSNNNKTSSLTSLSTTEEPTTTTTEAEFKLTRPVLQSLIRRNVKGLVRLFNIEWRDALKQSEINMKEFQHDLGKQVGMYLQDNPDAY